MNERQKYINDLSIYLRQLTDEERNDALEFYDEYIADAVLETRTAIEERLGTP
ncbi:HAAS signaling domain-containing protein [Limosilactobacillus reuteri]|uniref:HAAS signaling domain-containing protein n=1 Tax=Limosilactobacillus reuteri TaxID=1598 RepID=UPI001CDB640A